MPPEMIASSSLALSDVLTVIAIIVGLTIQSWGAWRWLANRFMAEEKARQDLAQHGQESLSRALAQIERVSERGRIERAKLDGRIMRLEDRVSRTLTQEEIADIFRAEITPLKDILRTALALPPVKP